MARLKDGPLNIEGGKIGGVVTYTMNGKKYVRAMPVTTKRPPSLLQKINQQKQTVATQFTASFKDVIRKTIPPVTGKTQYTSTLSYNRNNALAGEYPNYYIDKSKAVLSNGDVGLPSDAAMTSTQKGLSITWEPNYSNKAHSHDTLIVIYKCTKAAFADYRFTGAQRRDKKCLLSELPLGKHQYDIWIAFRRYDETGFSKSLYLGTTP